MTLQAVDTLWERQTSLASLSRSVRSFLDKRFPIVPIQATREEEDLTAVARERTNVKVIREEDKEAELAWWIAQRVIQARKKRGWRQEDLARSSGIRQPNIARIEKGKHVPTLATLLKVSEALELEVSSLLVAPQVTEAEMDEDRALAELGLDEWSQHLNDEDSQK